jgi:dTDP-4-dehydrorhamnose 3,5-epimerase-like enzyme
MAERTPIEDIFIRRLQVTDEANIKVWHVLGEKDHLLRRFEQAEVVHVQTGFEPNMHLRQVADEVWALFKGHIEFVWHDLRPDSPSHDQWQRFTCHQPTLVLVPFGVAFGYRALNGPATLLRLTTHADGQHTGDQEFPWEQGE